MPAGAVNRLGGGHAPGRQQAGGGLMTRMRVGVPILVALAVAVGGCSSSDTVKVADKTAPMVVTFLPAEAATGVVVNTPIQVTFSEVVSLTSIKAGGWTISPDVAGTFTVGTPDANQHLIVTFTPTVQLTANTSYTVTVGDTVKDLAGNALTPGRSWTFTTGTNNARAAVVADANVDVLPGATVSLDGSASTDVENATLTYTWTQVSGADVTGGTGALAGATPSFTAPDGVATVAFDLVVSDGFDASAPVRVVVTTLRNPDAAIFVSTVGDDAAAGTRAAPVATMSQAITLASTMGTGAGVYAAAGTYDGTVALQTGVHVFGGFDPTTWLRDTVVSVTEIRGVAVGMTATDVTDVRIDGVKVTSTTPADAGGSAYGLVLVNASVEVAASTIQAADGAVGAAGSAGENGVPGSAGGAGSTGSCNGTTPGTGGTGGMGQPHWGGNGGRGGSAGSSSGVAGGSGYGPAAGAGGAGGGGGDPGRAGSAG